VTEEVLCSVIRNLRFLIGSKIATRFSNACSHVEAVFYPDAPGVIRESVALSSY